MSKDKYRIGIFILVVLFQLYIPLKMILDQENIISDGEVYRFKLRPVDPNDPFRGKFINLRFDAARFVHNDSTFFDGVDYRKKDVFVTLGNDEGGFAKVISVSLERPDESVNFLTARVRYSLKSDILLDYPFKRYYMDEFKAYEAEKLYREKMSDTTVNVYGIVNVLNGESVLTDVQMNGASLKDLIDTGKSTD